MTEVDTTIYWTFSFELVSAYWTSHHKQEGDRNEAIVLKVWTHCTTYYTADFNRDVKYFLPPTGNTKLTIQYCLIKRYAIGIIWQYILFRQGMNHSCWWSVIEPLCWTRKQHIKPDILFQGLSNLCYIKAFVFGLMCWFMFSLLWFGSMKTTTILLTDSYVSQITLNNMESI